MFKISSHLQAKKYLQQFAGNIHDKCQDGQAKTVQPVWKPGDLSFPCREELRRENQYGHYLTLNTIYVIFFVDTYYMCGINSLTSIFNSVLIGKPFTVSFLIFVII